MNLLRFDAPRNHHFPTLAIVSSHEDGDRLSRGHPSVCVVVVTHPNYFIVGYAEVDSRDSPTASALQFAQPLM
jgi:hypothetical protein